MPKVLSGSGISTREAPVVDRQHQTGQDNKDKRITSHLSQSGIRFMDTLPFFSTSRAKPGRRRGRPPFPTVYNSRGAKCNVPAAGGWDFVRFQQGVAS